MSGENCSNDTTTRREFLKQTLITTGYMLPVVTAIQLGSLDAWANGYPKIDSPAHHSVHHPTNQSNQGNQKNQGQD